MIIEAEKYPNPAQSIAFKKRMLKALMLDIEAREHIYNGHSFADLGLSVCWAKYNLHGDQCSPFFRWGENEAFDINTPYTSQDEFFRVDFTYQYPSTCKLDNIKPNGGYTLLKDPSQDAAVNLWGGGWRIPNAFEVEELIKKCSWEHCTDSDVPSYKVTGPSGESIIFPLLGYSGFAKKTGHDIGEIGRIGNYWTSYAHRGEKRFHPLFLCLHAYNDTPVKLETGRPQSLHLIKPVFDRFCIEQ